MPIVIKKMVAGPKPEPLVEKASPAELINAYPVGKIEKTQAHCDGMYRVVRSEHSNAVVPWWLMASYLYYHHDVSLVSDALYDEMAKDLSSRWGEIRHPHKGMITQEDLLAGTFYGLPAKSYPMSCRAAAKQLVSKQWGLKIDIDH